MTRAAEQGGASRPVAAALGPALIVVAVFVVMWRVAFQGLLPHDLDTESAFLPWFCFMGKSLAAGHVPAWNPYPMGGAPFAANPLAGWMYLPVMALFTPLRCDVAMRLFVILKPALGGLGLYWFLRSERLGRVAATAGGVALALCLAGTSIAMSAVFSGVIAWTPFALGAASRFFRASTWPARLVWAALAGVAWSQIAASHLSHGVIIGTGAVAAFSVVALRRLRREEHRSAASLLTQSLVLLAAVPTVALAVLLPKLAYLPQTSLGHGYRELFALARSLSGARPARFRVTGGLPVKWGFDFASPLARYIGATGVLFSFCALWSRRLRPLAVGFLAYALLFYLASLSSVERAIAPVVRHVPFGDFAQQLPLRFGHALMIAIPVLVALGVEAWREPALPVRRILMALPGAAVWWLLPLALGVRFPSALLLVAGVGAATAVMIASTLRPAFAVLVPVVLAAELAASALLGQATPGSLGQFHRPTVSTAALLRDTPPNEIIRASGERFLTLDGGERPQRSYANGRAILFGIEEAQGYDPVQEFRYWTFVRAQNPGRPLLYHSAIFREPAPAAVGLLQIGWILAQQDRTPDPSWTPVSSDAEWTLYRLPDTVPRASAVPRWRVVPDSETILPAISAPAFDSRNEVLLERDPGLTAGFAPGVAHASFRWLGTQSAQVVEDSPDPAIVLVRNVYDPNWRATIDGRPAPVLRADYFLQAVAVPGGRHVVRLWYDDPWIGYGVLGSGLSLILLLGTAAGLWMWKRREAPPPGEAGP